MEITCVALPLDKADTPERWDIGVKKPLDRKFLCSRHKRAEALDNQYGNVTPSSPSYTIENEKHMVILVCLSKETDCRSTNKTSSKGTCYLKSIVDVLNYKVKYRSPFRIKGMPMEKAFIYNTSSHRLSILEPQVFFNAP